MKKNKKLVAVVVPMSNRAKLTPDEEISLRHLRHYLGRYDKFMIAPPGTNVHYDDFKPQCFDDSFFGSARAHNRLLTSPKFYNTFKNYEYILIYHLDALVLSDQLTDWCTRDFDYLAPPWIKYEGAPYGSLPLENKIGNGGFSLRKIESFLRVLRAVKRPQLTRAYLRRILRRAKKEEHKGNEDVFWGLRAQTYDPTFKVADFETALQFAFECNPQLCFETNHEHLPFGCHAWPTYDRAFWEPHLLPSSQ